MHSQHLEFVRGSVQNLSSLTLKTKELGRGSGKHPPPPMLHQPKKPGACRVN